MSTLLAYWYHFAIMFEALFILTTIDTGTRIGRFLMQEFMARALPELGKSTSRTGGLLATGLVVGGWTYFILTGNISTIWPMFGIANQLLACAALCVATTILLRESSRRIYALTTFLPLLFVGTTTIAAGVESIGLLYLPMSRVPATKTVGLVNATVTMILLACICAIAAGSAASWLRLLRADSPSKGAGAPAASR
jgi:carbon starvation protein